MVLPHEAADLSIGLGASRFFRPLPVFPRGKRIVSGARRYENCDMDRSSCKQLQNRSSLLVALVGSAVLLAGGCIKLTPSPLQDVGPAVSAVVGAAATTTPPCTECKTFRTSSTSNANLVLAEGNSLANGILAADALCARDANHPGTGTYKALIVDGAGNRRASVTASTGDGQVDWVLRANTSYYRSDGTTLIGTTNANGIFTFPLSASVAPTPVVNYWTGLNPDWTTDTSNNCSNWTTNAGDGRSGAPNVVDSTSIGLPLSTIYCSPSQAIWCIEQ